jgi:hypothetical protein
MEARTMSAMKQQLNREKAARCLTISREPTGKGSGGG